jgi:hypothetical protein
MPFGSWRPAEARYGISAFWDALMWIGVEQTEALLPPCPGETDHERRERLIAAVKFRFEQLGPATQKRKPAGTLISIEPERGWQSAHHSMACAARELTICEVNPAASRTDSVAATVTL